MFISTRSWEPLYDTEVLLRAFHHAYQQNKRLRLLLLGDGSLASRVRSLIAEHELDQSRDGSGDDRKERDASLVPERQMHT